MLTGSYNNLRENKKLVNEKLRNTERKDYNMIYTHAQEKNI